MQRRLKDPQKHRTTYRVFPDDAVPQRYMVVLSRIAAALLCGLSAVFSVVIIQTLISGMINFFSVVFAIIMLPSVVISAIGIFHKRGLYYLRVYESETRSKPGAPPEGKEDKDET